MHSETRLGLANSPNSFAVSYVINAYSTLHYSGQSKHEVPYFTAAPTILLLLPPPPSLSLSLSLSLCLCVASTKLCGNHQNGRNSSVISETKIIIIKKKNKGGGNDSEINFTFSLMPTQIMSRYKKIFTNIDLS
jgi:hypothetical protein